MMNNPMKDKHLFGDADARNAVEREGLRRYFIERPYFTQIETGMYSIIVGEKGSGKTAIKSKLLEQKCNVFNVEIDPILPTNGLFKSYAELNGLGEEGSYATYERAWVSYIVATLFLRMRDAGISWGKHPEIVEDAINRLKLSEIENYKDRIKKISVGIDQVASGSIELEKKHLCDFLPTEAEIPTLISILQIWAERADLRIVLLVDRIDQGLEDQFTIERIQSYRKYIGGLCLATSWINSKIDPSRFTIYSFIRKDLYDQLALELHSVTEFESLALIIDWKMDALTDIIAKRISTYFGDVFYNENADFQERQNLFNSDKILFRIMRNEKLDGVDVWRYCLMHTQLKPRDLIFLLDSFRRASEYANKSIIDGNSITNGMIQYSRKKFQELLATVRYRITNAHKLFSFFRGSPLIWEQKKLLKPLNDFCLEHGILDLGAEDASLFCVEKIIQCLFDFGFLVGGTGDDSKLSFSGYYNSPYYKIFDSPIVLPTLNLDFSSKANKIVPG